MKLIVRICLFSLVWIYSSYANEYKVLHMGGQEGEGTVYGESIELLKGQTLDQLGYETSGTNRLGSGGGLWCKVSYLMDNGASYITGLTADPLIEGPAIIQVGYTGTSEDSYFQGYYTWFFRIKTIDADFVPSGAVVIPSDDGGPVNIRLESVLI